MGTSKRRKQDFILKQHPMTEADLDNLPPTDELASDIIAGKLSGIQSICDSGPASDSVAVNFEHIFETYSPKVKREML